jgi:AcrR family transcriptional regulator
MDQKLRLRIALSTLVAESGYEGVTVRSLIRRASVSTSTFYNHYDGVEDCLAGIVGMTIQILVGDIKEGQKAGADPLAGFRTGLRHLIERLAREPQMAQAVFIEAFAAGPRVREEMDEALEDLEKILAETFSLAPRPVVGTTHLAAGLVAGMVGTIRRTVLAGRAEELPELTDELTDWMLSVAHEEVATFFVPRSRPAGGIVGDRLPLVGVIPTSRESVADASRRAVMAAARLAAADGLAGLTSAKIRKDAGLSRREFEQHFTGVEDCFLDAVESVAAMAASVAESAGAGALSWERRIFKWMSALCALAAGDRDLSRLVLLDVVAPGRPGLLRREELIGRAAAAIRDLAPLDRRPSELAATASVCAIWRVAETEVAARRTTELPRLAAVFVYMILAARRSRGEVPDRAHVVAPRLPELSFPVAAPLAAPAA